MPHETPHVARAQTRAGLRSTHAEDLRSLEAGLDRLQTDRRAPPSRWRRIRRERRAAARLRRAPHRRSWQLYVVIAQPRPDIVPGPLDVLGALGDAWEAGRLQEAVITSLERGVVGFLIAIVVGTPIGLLLAEVRPLRRAVGPIISGLQVLPSVAWVPAAIIWFGLSDATVYFVILMGAIPSIVNGLIAGVDQVPPQLRRVGTVLGASRWQLATAVILPAALPGIPRRPQAGLGVLVALADGRRDHRDRRLDRLRARLDAAAVARTRRPRRRARDDPPHPVHRHPDRAASSSGRSSGGC